MKKNFTKINYLFVPMPSDIWDRNIKLTLAEFRLLGYLIRHTVNWGNERVRLTDEELLHGRRYSCAKARALGRARMDDGAGIKGRNNLRKARTSLARRGWIVVDEDLADRARPLRWYRVKMTASKVVSDADSQMLVADDDPHPTDNDASLADTRSDNRECNKIKKEEEVVVEGTTTSGDCLVSEDSGKDQIGGGRETNTAVLKEAPKPSFEPDFESEVVKYVNHLTGCRCAITSEDAAYVADFLRHGGFDALNDLYKVAKKEVLRNSPIRKVIQHYRTWISIDGKLPLWDPDALPWREQYAGDCTDPDGDRGSERACNEEWPPSGKLYLNGCLWSVYEHIGDVVIFRGSTSEKFWDSWTEDRKILERMNIKVGTDANGDQLVTWTWRLSQM